MAIVISVGLQKGGISKTTTAAIISYLLSQEARVLAVDFDSQGNLSEVLSRRDIYDFEDRTIFEACRDRNAAPYIYEITDTLHLLPAEDLLGGFSTLTTDRRYNYMVLADTLATVKDNYDYVIIDMAPQLGEQTLNVLYASDFTFSPLVAGHLCYKTIKRYLNFVRGVQELNCNLVFAGILMTLFEPKVSLDKAIHLKLREVYPNLVFKTTIHKRTKIKEFAFTGITEKTKADRLALAPYREFIKELKSVVGKQNKPLPTPIN